MLSSLVVLTTINLEQKLDDPHHEETYSEFYSYSQT
jgi:hypothetical protein